MFNKNMEDDNFVYLDYNATTPLHPKVVEIVTKCLAENWANPSSAHLLGRRAKMVIEEARSKVAIAIRGAKITEITFTSGGTESNHLAIHSVIKHFANLKADFKPHVVTTNIEHPAIDLPLKELEKEDQIELTLVEVDQKTGSVSAESIKKVIKSNTCLVSVMMANNETGVVQPIREIGEMLKTLNDEREKMSEKFICKIFFHTDAAQTIGKIRVDIKDLNVDYLTIVGHKFYGPRIGALFHAEGCPVVPVFLGGGQELGNRSGTENTPMIAGLGEAAKISGENPEENVKNLLRLRTRLYDGLKQKLGENFTDNFSHIPLKNRLPNTLSASFLGLASSSEGLTGSDLILRCRNPIVLASTQAACHSGLITEEGNRRILEKKEKSYSSILIKSGIENERQLKTTLRLSVGTFTTEKEIDLAVQSISNAYHELTNV